MEVTITRNGDEATVSIVGKVDTNTAPDLSQAIDTIPAEVTKVIFDLENMEYIASSGLRVLLTALKTQKSKQGTAILSKPNGMVADVLDATGFTEIFEIVH